jgi:hypothetical protein
MLLAQIGIAALFDLFDRLRKGLFLLAECLLTSSK